MKIAVVCVTYNRPQLLGQMIRCFERQDYADRELVILDDAGQYAATEGLGWRLYSTDQRFSTLGEKRNAAARLVSNDVEAFAVWDDDDLYMPWALRASVAALNNADWSRPSLVLHPQPSGSLRQHRTGGLFHSGWAYRRGVFAEAGGYPTINNGEDQGLAERLNRLGVTEADPMTLGFLPFLVYPWFGRLHFSSAGAMAYENWGRYVIKSARVQSLEPSLRLDASVIEPGIYGRIFDRRIEGRS
jgi:glycosyltransferase involved in cell wall biosynthesis